MRWEDISANAILLFLVMDPLGNVPLFLSVLERVEPARRQRIIARELVIALGALLVFLASGEWLLAQLGIRQSSLSVAGGIIVFLIALRMVFPPPKILQADDELDGEPFVVPLAIPLVAGPSAFATLLLIGHRETTHTGALFLALLLAWGVSAVILLLSEHLRRLLGRRGLIAVERLSGMVLVALAVQMFLDGVRLYLAAP
jgi:multiple antibiotic resistance protein